MDQQQRRIGVREGVVAVVAAVLLALAGCHSSNRLRPAYLSGDSRLVGGGLKIEWKAPEPGTVYLVEKRTGKLVQTYTLNTGETYKFSVESPVEADDLGTILGIDIDRAQFLLYFKPAGGREPILPSGEPARG
ncbi:MAG: hypothetical protein ABFE01_25985 [Phycisphaerales bacterium]|jgi:hypothetical protein